MYLSSPTPHANALLKARPGAEGKGQFTLPTRPPSSVTSTAGTVITLGVDPGEKDALLVVPPTYDPSQPSPLIVLLHGACATGADVLRVFDSSELARGRVLLLCPSSRGRTWDVIRSDFGPDVEHIDAALARTFDMCRVDGCRLAIAGFSDGASYALSLGLPNSIPVGSVGGQGGGSSGCFIPGAVHSSGLYSHIIALSPGFMRPPFMPSELPKVYIAHGEEDEVLNIEKCSRRIIQRLTTKYGLISDTVKYNEFHGAHSIPREVSTEALAWFLE